MTRAEQTWSSGVLNARFGAADLVGESAFDEEVIGESQTSVHASPRLRRWASHSV